VFKLTEGVDEWHAVLSDWQTRVASRRLTIAESLWQIVPYDRDPFGTPIAYERDHRILNRQSPVFPR